MKLRSDRPDIHREGVGKETEFKIRTTAKAFDILSSGLYTDNIAAIIRELACNAYDSHVAAGRKQEPFQVHLPNQLAPFFSIKDFGTGLSDTDVMSLYTTYFESTKTDSNDFIGALGLGSKSPFSYTKSFEVISRFKGTRRIYSVFINEQGVPTIAQLGAPIATDEHDGLEVKITVHPSDFNTFGEKAAKVLRWFPVKPIIVGAARFKIDEQPAIALKKSDNWYICNDYHFVGDMIAIQGNVEYRVSLSLLRENAKPDIMDTIDFIRKVRGVVCFFDIGELEVAASREEIKYDDKTKEAIFSKIRDIRQVVNSTFEEIAAKHEGCLWDTYIEVSKTTNKFFPSKHSVYPLFSSTSSHPSLVQYKTSMGNVRLHHENYGHTIYTYICRGGSTRFTRRNVHISSIITPSENACVFVNDIPMGGISRMTEWARKHNKSTIIAITPNKNPKRPSSSNSSTFVAMSKKEIANELKNIIDDLGNPKILTVSKDTQKATRRNYPRRRDIFQYDGVRHHSYRNAVVDWARVPVDSIDMNSHGLYFCLERGSSITWNDSKILVGSDDVKHWFSTMVDVINSELPSPLYSTQNLFGIPKHILPTFTKATNWKNIFDLFAAVINTHKADYEKIFQWRHYVSVNSNPLNHLATNEKFMARVSELDTTSCFRQHLELLKLQKKQHDDMIQNMKLKSDTIMRVLQIDRQTNLNIIDPVDSDSNEPDNVWRTYPLLKHVFDHFASRKYDLDANTQLFTDVLTYITLIDNS